MDDHVYRILESAQARGLIAPMSGVRPYTRAVVERAIREMLLPGNSGRLSALERRVLEDRLADLRRPEPGLDLRRGIFFAESAMGRAETPLSFFLDLSADFQASASLVPELGETSVDMEGWLRINFSGDIGRNVSYGLYNEAGLIRAQRRSLGLYNTYYEGFSGWDERFENRLIRIYGGPITHFPFSYEKRWDGSIFPLDDPANSSFSGWPNEYSIGYGLHAEIAASFLDDALILRMGRMRREWGSTPVGTGLMYNAAARPFLAAEAEFSPFSWITFSSITGILEYENREGIRDSALAFQNAFSMIMLQLRLGNYLFLDLFDAAIWPKRFEFGYMFPLTSNLLTQNNIGYFDNMAIGMNLVAQYPGLGNVWASLFVDEMAPQKDMWNLSRTMIAYQGGLNFPLPLWAFTNLRLSYTKINPFAYTHTRNTNPWNNGIMHTGWQHNGAALGHYLPPNSDEFMAQLRTMPARGLTTTFQYQLIRRGANFGSGAVMGSDLFSELDPASRSENPRLRRYFLRDGTYQWMHIARLNAEWSLPGLPIAIFGEAGAVFSRFTGIDGPSNSGEPRPFSRIDTPEYPTTTTVLFKLGITVLR